MSTSEVGSQASLAASPMSVADFGDIAEQLHTFVQALMRGRVATVSGPALSQAIGDLAKLHLACQEAAPGRVVELSGDDITGSEAVALIANLMRAQNLNTFDLALWLSRVQPPAMF